MTYDPEPYARWERARDERASMAVWIANAVLDNRAVDLTIPLQMYRERVEEYEAAGKALREPVPHVWSTPTS